MPSDRYAPPAFSGETELLFAEETEDAPQLYRLAEKKRIPITAFPFFIGSREGVDYDPGDRGVSRLHARLELRGGRYWIMDLNSTNGTALNGEELTPNEETELFHGDRVEIAGRFMNSVCLTGAGNRAKVSSGVEGTKWTRREERICPGAFWPWRQ